MDYQDKERYDRIRETLGDWCGFVELARVDETDADQLGHRSRRARASASTPTPPASSSTPSAPT